MISIYSESCAGKVIARVEDTLLWNEAQERHTTHQNVLQAIKVALQVYIESALDLT